MEIYMVNTFCHTRTLTHAERQSTTQMYACMYVCMYIYAYVFMHVFSTATVFLPTLSIPHPCPPLLPPTFCSACLNSCSWISKRDRAPTGGDTGTPVHGMCMPRWSVLHIWSIPPSTCPAPPISTSSWGLHKSFCRSNSIRFFFCRSSLFLSSCCLRFSSSCLQTQQGRLVSAHTHALYISTHANTNTSEDSCYEEADWRRLNICAHTACVWLSQLVQPLYIHT